MKSKILATMALLAISLLSGCGKSNNGPGVQTYGAGGSYIGGTNGQGGCYDLRSATGGTQIAFSGANYSQSGALIGNLTAVTSAVGGGFGYTGRDYGTGDRLQVFVANPGYGQQMTAIATLAPGTVGLIQRYGGYVCGLKVHTEIGAGNVLKSSSLLVGGWGDMPISL